MNKQKTIITATGFYNTGSSAITHLLSEVDGVENASDVYEMRILYDPDCISDLEYNLIETPHRQNSGYAVLRFKDYIDFNSNRLFNHHYERICDGNFKKISYEYINDLTEFRYQGASHLDVLRKGKLFWVVNRCYRKLAKYLIWNLHLSFVKETLMSPRELYAPTYKKDVFYLATKKYVGKVIDYLNKNRHANIMIDQFLPASNIKRYINYLPDDYNIKVFIVDRDPRDLYVLSKKMAIGKSIPINSPIDFCKWFLWTRGQSMANNDPGCVMRVQFEDLIYDYEKTRDKIIKFCQLEDQTNGKKGTVFKPEMSINNTQTWYRYPDVLEDVKIIEDNLKEFCYDFDSYTIKPDFQKGKMFDC